MTAASPSWNLSRAVRTAIVCRDQKVSGRTATLALIGEVAASMLKNRHKEIAGYDARTVRAILLDKSLASPYPPEAPAAYAGK